MTDIATRPDFAAIKQRQQATWASGDYHMIGTQILLSSELLIEALDVHAGERVLDVATGSGNAALAAARRGCSVVGLDYVPDLLERARIRAAAEGVTADFIEGDAEALPFEDGSFDAVVAGELFEHLQFPDALVAEIVRVLRPGGVLAGSVPNAFRVQSRLRFLRGEPPEDDPTHLRMFSPAALRQLLSRFGRVELRYVGGRYARLNARLFARDLVFTAVKPS